MLELWSQLSIYLFLNSLLTEGLTGRNLDWENCLEMAFGCGDLTLASISITLNGITYSECRNTFLA